MLHKQETENFRQRWIGLVAAYQERICGALETLDGQAQFSEDLWERTEPGGGGGRTRVIVHGKVLEKGGVNSSVVGGPVTEGMRRQLQLEGSSWFASGLSIVLHPSNPYAPTVHANWRYFELWDEAGFLQDRWFGGGSDLTPYYLFEEDAQHFHQTLKNCVSSFSEQWYDRFKKQCDQYFVNTHRGNEARGIGGIFYDQLRPVDERDADRLLAFQEANANAFLASYLPLVERRKNMPFGPQQKKWQEIRRGRYVEFNLIHDRGTLFGLRTHGRTESILMSLPPTLRFEYNYAPEPGSEEDKLLQVCLHPRDWV
jgi:coproporphyrinogen III oxidase